MNKKKLPFTKDFIKKVIEKYPTPFHIYDEKAIIANLKRFQKAFSWGIFKEYFAVKACPNPSILKILKNHGAGADCSSLPELIMSEKVGITGENIMFTSNQTPKEEYIKAKELGAIINLDDITHIPYLKKHAGIPELICFRYNPGPLRTGNAIIGNPVESKYGLTKDQVFEAYKEVRELGAKRFGIHSFVISNELNRASYVETAKMLFELAVELKNKIDIKIEFVNLSGGIGIPYKPEQEAVDLEKLGEEIRQLYDKIVVPNGLDPLKIYSECGRMITGPYGYLVTT
ncbi:MAG TPA: diaminopimelate decarboxylase, partial [Spirochaetota bacterium]|nr:diaminopimelate decarboxylase [Spirochaetota bacterium]